MLWSHAWLAALLSVPEVSPKQLLDRAVAAMLQFQQSAHDCAPPNIAEFLLRLSKQLDTLPCLTDKIKKLEYG